MKLVAALSCILGSTLLWGCDADRYGYPLSQGELSIHTTPPNRPSWVIPRDRAAVVLRNQDDVPVAAATQLEAELAKWPRTAANEGGFRHASGLYVLVVSCPHFYRSTLVEVQADKIATIPISCASTGAP
jgi:hypothetical protein